MSWWCNSLMSVPIAINLISTLMVDFSEWQSIIWSYAHFVSKDRHLFFACKLRFSTTGKIYSFRNAELTIFSYVKHAQLTLLPSHSPLPTPSHPSHTHPTPTHLTHTPHPPKKIKKKGKKERKEREGWWQRTGQGARPASAVSQCSCAGSSVLLSGSHQSSTFPTCHHKGCGGRAASVTEQRRRVWQFSPEWFCEIEGAIFAAALQGLLLLQGKADSEVYACVRRRGAPVPGCLVAAERCEKRQREAESRGRSRIEVQSSCFLIPWFFWVPRWMWTWILPLKSCWSCCFSCLFITGTQQWQGINVSIACDLKLNVECFENFWDILFAFRININFETNA